MIFKLKKKKQQQVNNNNSKDKHQAQPKLLNKHYNW